MPSAHSSSLPPSSRSPSRSYSRSPRPYSRHTSGRHTQSSPPPVRSSHTSDQERIKELERQILSLENSNKAEFQGYYKYGTSWAHHTLNWDCI
ncbi:hypothetical protein GYMLUDRAFT_51495 [Collybiopsis luxurians FD-317 M1]|uniref:Unplaced genomic scaffold GYMLUscaffold_237, whole genome shotgun sequence n=1 Tax=Collybiopsis luxurians FD-317 M1 TaxID=944289 RepID=A0A0D0AI70_9AGAR|nr:hypothetical protein GYMLUDRAFT_51495 [Collybiopsis luxurians FD-317 M1]